MKRTTLIFLLFLFTLRCLFAQCVVDISPGLAENLQSVHFINASNGMAVGDDGTIITTTDGGNTWNTSIDPHTNQHLNSVFMVSAAEAWIVGDGGIIRHTTDGGNTWQQQYSPTTCNLTGVRFNSGNGIIVGECGIVLVYNPASGSWNSRRIATKENFLSVRFTDDDSALAAGEKGTLFQTDDAGFSWFPVVAPSGADIMGFEINGDSGYLSTSAGEFFLSPDAGASWPGQATPGNTIQAVAAFDPFKAIAVGSGGFVGKTSDAGSSWIDLTNPAISGNFSSVVFPDSTVAYAVGEAGLVVKILFLEITANGDDLVCDGAPVSLSTIGPGTPVGYQWTGPNFSSDQPNPPVFAATTSSSGSYIITASVNGCTTTDTFELSVASLPVAVATGFELSCDPGVSNQLQGGPGLPDITFLWNGPGISTANSTLQNPTVLEAGNYFLTVTDANGCTGTASAEVTGNADFPAIGIEPAAGNTTLDCHTPSINLESIFSIQNGEITWTLPDNSTATTQNISASLPGVYQVNILNTDNGCASDTSINISANFAIPTASAVAAGLIGCNSSTATLNATSDIGTSFVWTGPSPSTTTYNGPNVSVTEPGEYTLTVTAGNGCSGTASAMVAADFSLPSLSLTPNQNQTGCLGDTISLTATTNAPGLNWNTGSTDALLEIPLDITGSTTFSVTATGSNGCDTTLSIVITTAPTPDATATATDIDCSGEGQLFGADSPDPVSYLWSGPNAFSSNEQNPTVTAVGQYFLVVTNTLTGCSATTTTAVALEQGIPDASISPPGAAVITCLVDAIELSGNSSVPGVSFEWLDENDNPISSNSSLTATAGGVYTLVVTNPALPNCPASAEITIGQDTTPDTFSIAGDVIPCPGASITLSALPDSPTADLAFQWSGPLSGQDDTLLVDTDGVYTVTGTTLSNGCTHTETFTVSTNPAPTVSLGDNTNVCDLANNPVTLMPIPPVWTSYQWSNGTTGTTTEVDTPGNYAVTVTNTDGCTAVNEVFIGNANNTTLSQSANLCSGSVLEIGGTVIDSPGTYVINLPGNAAACDTTLTLNVTGVPLDTLIETEYLCEGSSLTVYNTTFDSGGLYEIILPGSGNACPTVVMLTVNQVDSITVPALTGEQMPCAGSTEVFTIGGYDSSLQYDWPVYPPGTTIIDNGNTATITFGNSPGVLQMTATDARGCFSEQVSLDIQILEPPAQPAPTDVPLPCVTQSTNVSVQTVTNAESYTWTLPDGSVQTTTGTTSPPFSVEVAGPFSVLVSASNKCGESAPLAIQTSALANPSATLTGNTILCPGESAGLQVTLTGNAPWTVGYSDGTGTALSFTTSQSDFTLSVSPGQTSTFQLTSVQSGNCVGTATGAAVVTVVQDTSATITQAQICQGDQYDFYGEIFDQTGTYTVPIVYSSTCSTQQVLDLLVVDPDLVMAFDTTLYVEAGEGFYELPALSNLYPNPAAGLLINLFPLNNNQLTIEDGRFYYNQNDSLLFAYSVGLEACPDVVDTALIKMIFRSNCFSAKNEYMPRAFIGGGRSTVGTVNEKFDPCEAVAYCLTASSDCDVFTDQELVIYNGWGEIVFDSKLNGNSTVWRQEDANNFPEATYYYSFKFTYQGRTEIIKGPISIVKKK